MGGIFVYVYIYVLVTLIAHVGTATTPNIILYQILHAQHFNYTNSSLVIIYTITQAASELDVSFMTQPPIGMDHKTKFKSVDTFTNREVL